MSRLIPFALLLLAACDSPPPKAPNDPHIASLSALTVERLRSRDFSAAIRIETEREHRGRMAYLASYDSDGLRVYTRVDIPTEPPPPDGYPVVLFVHGWVGIDKAPAFDFFFESSSDYAEIIDAYVAAGFAVLSPGLRGHGSVNGIAADGIEFLAAWDNGSYLSPVFYAIDVLNLLDGLHTFETAPLDLQRVNLFGHSQGGDVALIALAIAGEGSAVNTQINAASIWSGTFAPRLTQLMTYWPMQSTPEAFLAGDGSWNGTAVGANGAVNNHFVFGYPADWIETPHPAEWTWQNDTWSLETVPDALAVKLEEMYSAINAYSDDINDAEFHIAIGDAQVYAVLHDERVIAGLLDIGAWHLPEYLTEPLLLQHSDRDFYSLPDWNAELCRHVNQARGRCRNFSYPENTHALKTSAHSWFSSPSAKPGFSSAIQRDIELFLTGTLALRSAD